MQSKRPNILALYQALLDKAISANDLKTSRAAFRAIVKYININS